MEVVDQSATEAMDLVATRVDHAATARPVATAQVATARPVATVLVARVVRVDPAVTLHAVSVVPLVAPVVTDVLPSSLSQRCTATLCLRCLGQSSFRSLNN